MSETRPVFGMKLGGSISGEIVNGIPTLYRQAFSTVFTEIKLSNTKWVSVEYSALQSARFSAMHEVGHIINPKYSEVKVNKWAYERM